MDRGNALSEVSLPGAGDLHARMHKMIFGASVVQMLRCAALYSLADHLAEGAAAPEIIAAAEGFGPGRHAPPNAGLRRVWIDDR